ncbi:MAG: hypothetical protein WC707_06170 [Candidatus Babeliaceae bacterium]|jgi:hypothetical protein
MKELSIILMLFISFFNYIYGGSGWSALKPKSQNAKIIFIEQIGQEVNTYLQTINLDAITTRQELEHYLGVLLSTNLRNPKHFPLFNECIKQEAFQQNMVLGQQLDRVMSKVVEDFVTEKSVIFTVTHE